MTISKNKLKFFHLLERKKNRDELGLFVAEGEKLVAQLIDANFKFHTIITTTAHVHLYNSIKCELVEADYTEIKKISSLKTPQEVVAICYQPKHGAEPKFNANELIIALDDIQDPGNLGTIIRLASWFGVRRIVCSLQTADCFNPKVIQATMGAIAHVEVNYIDLKTYLSNASQQNIPVYGTFLEGKVIYKTKLSPGGIVVMGNEGNGISLEIEKLVDHKLFIPSFSTEGENVESLNVSMATAIICSEFRRDFIE